MNIYFKEALFCHGYTKNPCLEENKKEKNPPLWHSFINLLKMKANLCTNEMDMLFSFIKALNTNWISATVWHWASSTFLKVAPYFAFFNHNIETTIPHKYTAQNSKSIFRAISGIMGNSVLVSWWTPSGKRLWDSSH